MSANRYVAGQVVRVRDTITVNGAVVNPATVNAHATKPNGTTVTGTATHDATDGSFYFDVVTAVGEEGTWWYRFDVASGTGQGAGEQSFSVEKSRIV